MKKVDFVFFDAGGGHRSAATALASIIEKQQRPWRVRLINLQEVLDSLDVFRKITGVRMEDVYNNLLKRGWTLGSGYLVPVMHSIIRLYHPAQVRMLTDFWKKDKPDMVVSVVPNFNRAMYQALQRVDPAIPYVTVITDIADYPPHFWMEKQDQHIIGGSKKAVDQAHGMGYSKERIFGTSGMILRPEFYEPPDVHVATERQKLGLDPQTPTALILFGGQGASVMVDIVRRLDESNQPLQIIAVCGRNEKLGARLKALRTRNRVHVVGFTKEIPFFMRISDFMIGKPGPGSISEALAMKLPVIITRNAWTLPQERYNAEWVEERGVGIVISNYSELTAATERMLSDLPAFRARVEAVDNQAVFEIPDILEQILRGAQ